MQNSMWKLATLLGVIGVGSLVVMQVQKNLPPTDPNAGTMKQAESTGDSEVAEDPFADLDVFGEGAPENFEPGGTQQEPPIQPVGFSQEIDPPKTAARTPEFDAFDDGVKFDDTSVASTSAGRDDPAEDLFGPDPQPQPQSDPIPAEQTDVKPGRTDLAPTTPSFPQESRSASAEPDPFAARSDEPGLLFGGKSDQGLDAEPSTGPPQPVADVDQAFGDEPFTESDQDIGAKSDSTGRAKVDLSDTDAMEIPFEDDTTTSSRAPAGKAPSFPAMESRDTVVVPADREPIAPLRDSGAVDPWPTEPSGERESVPEGPKVEPAAENEEVVRSGASRDPSPFEPRERYGIRRTSASEYDEKPLASFPQGTLKPQLRIEKSAPAIASIGQQIVYSITIHNDGNAIAREVVVEDRIPRGARLTGTIPRADLIDGTLTWRFAAVGPGEKHRIRIRVVPEAEGEVGSVATVNFKSEIASRTRVTAPKLVFSLVGHEEAKIGETVVFKYKVENVGSGDATNVWIRNRLPSQLRHPEGGDLEYEIGNLPSGSSRDVTLQLVAAGAGQVRNAAIVTADGGISTPAEADVTIIGSQLEVTRRGPKRRYLGRDAIYENTVTNTTHRESVNASLVERIPDGMRFVKASHGGRYNDAKRTVTWQIARVDPQQTLSFKIHLSPTRAGDQQSLVRLVEDGGFESRADAVTRVEHLDNMGLQLSELSGPVAVGERLMFTINIRNRGTSTATNSKLILEVPAELDVREAGPLQANRVQNRVEFDAIGEIEPGGSRQVRIAFVANAVAKDVRLRATIQSDQMPRSLLTEESITIYDDGR